jgi:hypothetical protein
MACRTGKAEPTTTSGPFPAHEPDGESVGVQEAGILRKIAIFEDIPIVTKELLGIRLFEVEEPVIRDELGSLLRVIEAIPLAGFPVLFEILDLLDGFSEWVDGRYIGLGYRGDVGGIVVTGAPTTREQADW